MAIDFASMLLQPTKTSAWNLSGGGGDSSLARENLAMRRKEFEETLRRHKEDERLRREAEASAMARTHLQAENEKAAKLQTDRNALFTEFTKQSGEGNAEAIRAMVPQMHALGMDVELEGEEGGMPRYRVGMDAAAYQQQEAARMAQASPYGEGETAEQSLSRIGAMGLGGETGSLLPPLGIRSSDEVDPETGASVSDRVAATYGMPGAKTATALPDEEDFTGGIPKNVIDLGASAQATLARLDPSLKAAAAAFPDAVTAEGAEGIRKGLRSSGLPFEKQAALFDKASSAAASQRNAQIGADAQRDRFRESRDELTETQAFAFEKAGRDDADKFATDNKIYDIGRALDAGDTILAVIDDPSPDNDAMIASELMTFQNVKGTPSDTDLKMAFGIPMSTLMDQALDLIGKAVKGGMQPAQRSAVKAYMAAKEKELKGSAFDYLDQAHARAKGGAYNERAKKAYIQTINSSVKGRIYNDWLDTRKQRDEGSTGDSGKTSAAPRTGNEDLAEMSDFELDLEGAALEADLDPAKMKRIIGAESGGRGDARNAQSGATGILQFMPSIAKSLGTSTEALAKMTPSEQLPFAIKYFKERGIDADSPAEDYAMAVAAPNFIGKPKDTVVYPKGSKAWEQNAPWRPADGGDITVGSIQAFYGGGSGKGASAKLPEPTRALDQSVADILRRAGN